MYPPGQPYYPGYPPAPYPPYAYPPQPPPGSYPTQPAQYPTYPPPGGYPTQPAPPQNANAIGSPANKKESIFSKFTQSIFVTKQKVLETIGQAQANIDQETQVRIDKLTRITAQYDHLNSLLVQLTSNFKAFHESQKLLGESLYENGVKEDENIAESMRQAGEYHRKLDKPGLELIESLKKVQIVISTFKNAAIQDTQINFEKFTKARQEYEGAQLRLEALEKSKSTSQDRLAAARIIVEESKKLMDKMSEDLHVKVVLLNEKRVQDLSVQLAEYALLMRNYFLSCYKVMEEVDINVPDESTEEFKKLMGGDV
eukprot:TRINITY_DN3685_c0_g1_i1.p1 TRINITY_DN3685_c0_g1~~TRINITY_DN3685_c0_g1_i1.p1  ORF type:complete len:313 (-),score=65.36 TRINITY_DN3685_c0_g1_i1:113-1051(-)